MKIHPGSKLHPSGRTGRIARATWAVRHPVQWWLAGTIRDDADRAAPGAFVVGTDSGEQHRCAGCGEARRDDQAVPLILDGTHVTDPVTGETTVKTIFEETGRQAEMVQCSCGSWYHAIGCLTTHHVPGWKAAPKIEID